MNCLAAAGDRKQNVRPVSVFHEVARNPFIRVCFRSTELFSVVLPLVTKRTFLKAQSKAFVSFYKSLEIVF